MRCQLAFTLRWHFDIGHSKVATHFNDVVASRYFRLSEVGFPYPLSVSSMARSSFRFGCPTILHRRSTQEIASRSLQSRVKERRETFFEIEINHDAVARGNVSLRLGHRLTGGASWSDPLPRGLRRGRQMSRHLEADRATRHQATAAPRRAASRELS
jgi:hypothetical protein